MTTPFTFGDAAPGASSSSGTPGDPSSAAPALFSFSMPPSLQRQDTDSGSGPLANPFTFAGAHVHEGGTGTAAGSSSGGGGGDGGDFGYWAGDDSGSSNFSGGGFGFSGGGGGCSDGKKRGARSELDLDDILGQITEKMNGLTTGNNSGDMRVEMLTIFMEVLDVGNEMAQFYLDSAAWNIEVAVSLCMETLQSHQLSRQSDMIGRQHAQHKRRSMDFKPREVVIEGLPSGWTARVSRHSGEIYFVNKITNQSQQHVPPGFADADPPESFGKMQEEDGSGCGVNEGDVQYNGNGGGVSNSNTGLHVAQDVSGDSQSFGNMATGDPQAQDETHMA